MSGGNVGERALDPLGLAHNLILSDAAHNDWFWGQYLPNGALAREGQTKLAGRVTSCINCHTRAGGRDFIFGNDQPPAR